MTSGIKGILFDVDGTLCDTNYLHTLAWSRALRDAGQEVPMAVLHRHMGMGSDRYTSEVLGYHSDDAVEFHENHYKAFWPEVRAFDRAAALVRALKSRGFSIHLASSAGPEELAILRQAIDADDVFETATNSDDAEESKPSPDIFAAALQRAGLEASEAIAVGDTVWDVEAAGKAGLRTIGFLSGGFSAAELRGAGAVEIWNDPAHMLGFLEESVISQPA